MAPVVSPRHANELPRYVTRIPAPAVLGSRSRDFAIKGVAYSGAIALYERMVPGGLAAVTKALSGYTSVFMAQDFYASVFYDIFPLADLDVVAARLCGLSLEGFVQAAMQLQAEHDLRVYGPMLRLVPASAVLGKLVAVNASYVNFGKAFLEKRPDQSVEVSHTQCPAEIAGWYGLCAAGYAQTALARAGAKDIRVDHVTVLPPERSATPAPVADVVWSIRWSGR